MNLAVKWDGLENPFPIKIAIATNLPSAGCTPMYHVLSSNPDD
jgi:hypothetical protein